MNTYAEWKYKHDEALAAWEQYNERLNDTVIAPLNERGTVAYYDFIIAALSYSDVIFDGWFHGEYIMQFPLNQFTDDECNVLINLARSGFFARHHSWTGLFRDASYIHHSIIHAYQHDADLS